ncbi:hypothetical protein [Streptomyces indicus]|uniref:Uncharacterized protein n=1 Tax=Streptomyces indicus TaxID=417292 RepID=A0A1G9CM13_9ACTN|nr:hypothetical protein [Streptomyces indicus]SDK52730.1 hypothetical protein SAMN05421806_108205 [Streptomyces indicus]
MNVVLALAAFSRAHSASASVREAGLFALEFSEQELGQRATPVWLFDAEPVRIPPPRGETPEQWADRWPAPDGGAQGRHEGLFQDRRQLAPVLRAVAEVCAASDDRPTVALVVLTGGPRDEQAALEVLRETAGRPVLFVFLTDDQGHLGFLDGLDRQPGEPADVVVIRGGVWSSAWARLRRTRGIRRAVSHWLRGLPLALVEPPEAAAETADV